MIEHYYKHVIEQAEAGIVIRDMTGRWLYANQAVRNLLGYSEAELVNQSGRDLTAPDDRGNAAEFNQKIQSGEIDTYTREKYYIHKNGTHIPVEVTITTIRDDAGKPVLLATVLKDMTERRKAEAAVRASEALLRAAFDQAAIGMAVRDLEGNWLRVNQTFCDMVGYSRAEFLRLRVRDISPPGERREADAYGARLREGTIATYMREKQYLRKDGSTFDALVTATVVNDPSSKGKHVLAIVQDVTARKAADNAARDSEARFRAAFEQAAVGMAIRGMDRRFIRVNSKLCEFFGYSEAELLKMTSLDLTPPEDRDDAVVLQNSIIEGRIEHYAREKRYVHKSGKFIWGNVAFTVVRDAQRMPLHLVVVIQDITDRKAAELELERYRENLEALVQARTAEFESAKQTAENANRAKSMFLSNISHELRTPLNAILGFAQLMDDPSNRSLSAEHRNWLDQIMKAGWHLLDLVDEVLDFGKIEAGRMSMALQVVPVADIVRAAISLAAPQALSHDITLAAVNIGPGVECVMADPVRLKQVLLNLLSNAVKFNAPKGRVLVWAQPASDGRVAISVTDTGMGLTPEQIQTLFVPFSRHVPKGRVIEGAGIGLALSKSLAELMGGGISVESAPGQGSTFTVTLAAAAREAVVADTAAAPGAVAQTPNVYRMLCIEDNPANMDVVRSFIRNRTAYERNNRPNAANRAEETLRTSLWQSGTRRC